MEALDRCRSSCDNLQFFECIDGQTHETCWNACGDRAESDLELFASCVQNSSPGCDPACLESLLDAETPDPPAPSGACEEACDAYVDAGCDVDAWTQGLDCATLCGALTDAEQQIATACLSAPQTCELDPACDGFGGEDEEVTTGGDEGSACTDACDDLLFFMCLDAQAHTECFARCDTAEETDVEAFVSCVTTGGGSCEPECYDVFGG